jgi:small subunit ribosomal protein S20
MPHTQSAKKRLRQNEKRRLRNRAAKKVVRVQLKKFAEVAKTGTLEQLQAEYKVTVGKVDRAAAHKVIHKNTAARKKAQLAKAVNKKAAAPPKPEGEKAAK